MGILLRCKVTKKILINKKIFISTEKVSSPTKFIPSYTTATQPINNPKKNILNPFSPPLPTLPFFLRIFAVELTITHKHGNHYH